MELIVTRRDTRAAPGAHYVIRCAEPDRRVAPDVYRHYSFYRTAHGAEVAQDNGYGTGGPWPLAADGDLFRAVKAAVEAYDAQASK